MEYTNQQLEEIERLASLYMPITDIAVIIDVPHDRLREDVATLPAVANAYRRGKVRTKLEMRKQEMQLAKLGSAQALESCAEALLEMEEDE